MTQCLFRRRRLDRIQRPGAKRPARCREDHALDVLAAAGAERLEYGVVLGVDRQHGGAGARRAPHEQGPGANQAFLVGEPDHGAAFNRRHRRLQSDRAADCRHHPIGRTLRGFEQSGFARRRLDAAAGQGILQFTVNGRIGDHGKPSADLAGDLRQRRRVTTGGDGLDAITFRLALDQIDGAGADRTGGAQNCDAAHGIGRQRFCSGKLGCRMAWYGHALTIPASRAQRRRNRHVVNRSRSPQGPRPRSRRGDPSRRHGRE